MNNLKKIMELKKITPIELAARSGVALSTIHRTMKDPQVTPYNGTAEQLAHALSCSVAEILGERAPGANNAELLGLRALNAAEELVAALRDYTPAPASVTVYADTNNGDGMNYYSVHIEDDDGNAIYNKAAYLNFNEKGELVFWQELYGERRGT